MYFQIGWEMQRFVLPKWEFHHPWNLQSSKETDCFFFLLFSFLFFFFIICTLLVLSKNMIEKERFRKRDQSPLLRLKYTKVQSLETFKTFVKLNSWQFTLISDTGQQWWCLIHQKPVLVEIRHPRGMGQGGRTWRGRPMRFLSQAPWTTSPNWSDWFAQFETILNWL